MENRGFSAELPRPLPLKVVKIGGNIVDNPAKLRTFLADFAALAGPKILVHGGGKVATSISAALGIETRMVEGRRVTDERTLEVVAMVYNGINKHMVSTLQSLGCDAIGLCGADGKLILSRRRPPVLVGKNDKVDYGFVGDPVSVNNRLVNKLINSGLTLVVAPITLDEQATQGGGVVQESGPTTGSASTGLLNTNADTVASAIATSMASSMAGDPEFFAGNSGRTPIELVYCFEQQGVMADIDDPTSVIERIDRARFTKLKADGTVHSGMLPKLENAFRALEAGVDRVVICAAENLSRPGYGGTTIFNR